MGQFGSRRLEPEGETNVLGFGRHAKANDGPCAHTKALPRWDKVEEAGDLERISGYYCPACDQFLPPARLHPGAEATTGAEEPD